jgi:integrase
MAPWKNKNLYWSDFTVSGRRYRLPLKTTDRREAIQLERDLIARAKEGKLASGVTAEFSRLPFDAALDRYLEEMHIYRQDGAKDPRKTWEGRLTERLRPFFRKGRLNQITADDIRDYQADRLKKGVHRNTINHEVKALLRLLKRAKLASLIRDDVKLLPVQREPRQMLTPSEKQRLFETAASKDEWQIAYCAALLTANTSMRPVEIRRLQWFDVDLEQRLVTVRRSKTEAGIRVIPLNDEAMSAIAALRRRACILGTLNPDCFVLPRVWPKVDGAQPMGAGGWRSAWRSLHEEAAKEDQEKGWLYSPQIAKFRYYDLRHQCVTEMLEKGVPEENVRKVAGHLDPAMTRHYSHPRVEALRRAVAVLGTVQPPLQESVTDGLRHNSRHKIERDEDNQPVTH